jgi:hypothetical protein
MRKNLGDIIKIIDPGLLYAAYDTAAKVMGLKKWKAYKNDVNKNKTYLVLNDFNHHKSGKRLLGITDGETDYIIGEEGVEVVESGTELKHIILEEAITPEQKCTLEYFDINNLSI